MNSTQLLALFGVIMACAASGVMLTVVLFGDMFFKSDESLKGALDFVVYAMLASLTAIAFAAADIAFTLCPLTPSVGI